MKPYHAYKPSGIDWIGDIPEHWTIGKLKHFCSKITDGSHVSPVSVDKGKRYISVKDVGQNFIDFENCKNISIEDFESLKRNGCQPNFGDILLTKDGTIGRATIVQNDNDYVVLSSLGIITPDFKKVSSQFLREYLVSDLNVNQMLSLIQGSALTRITITIINNLISILPPLPEQTAIAHYLDRKTSEIDTLIANKQRLIELLKEERTAIINQAVTKGINPNVRLKPSGIEWIGDIPEHWEVGKFNLLIKIRHGHQFMNYDFTENGIKIIKITQLNKDGYLDIENCSFISPDRLKEYIDIIIKEKDILMCLTGGTIGKIIRVGKVNEPLLQNYRVGHFSSYDDKIIIDDYIFWVMKSDSLISQIFYQMRETGQPNIGMGDFSRMKISLPPISEQIEIANFIETKTTEIDIIISKTEKEIDLMKEYKTALISEVVTGKVDVREA